MERDGQLIYTRRGTYAPVDKLDLICGRVSGHRDGFGFLIPDDGSDDLFLSPSQMRLVFDGDRALARVSGVDRRGRREGVLVEVISRAHESVVGRYFEEGGIGYVTPDNPKIQQEVLVTAGRNGGAKIGQFVEIKITTGRPHGSSRKATWSKSSATTWRRAWKSTLPCAATISRTSGPRT